MIRHDKGVVMPPAWRGHGCPRKYPWLEMLVGDSFFVDKSRFGSSSARAGKLYGRKFSTRHEGTGTRVWRIA